MHSQYPKSVSGLFRSFLKERSIKGKLPQPMKLIHIWVIENSPQILELFPVAVLTTIPALLAKLWKFNVSFFPLVFSCLMMTVCLEASA